MSSSSPPSMFTSTPKDKDPNKKDPTIPSTSTTKHKRAISRTSSVSGRRRSESRSTAGHSGQASRRNSHHTGRNTSLSPSVLKRKSVGGQGAGTGAGGILSQKKREDLLVLHRESCRLFQDQTAESTLLEASSNLQTTPTFNDNEYRPSIDVATLPSSSYITHPHPQAHHFPHASEKDPLVNNKKNSNEHDSTYQSPPKNQASNTFSRQIPVTVIDWMTPSTRRREYEKIDRQNRGVRGWWRRVAPRWCRLGDKRTPFFEEKNGKANYEGSVRRFRMDIPDEGDEDDAEETGSHLIPKQGVGNRKRGRRRWLCGFKERD